MRPRTIWVDSSVLEAYAAGIKFDRLHHQMSRQSTVEVSTADLREAIQQLEEEGVVGVSGDIRNRTVRLL